MTADMQTALAALRAHHECCIVTRADGSQWAAVYLDNAKPREWGGHKWAGVLSALDKAGVYRRNDDPDFSDIFGDVKLV
jgi:hypothetical protein